MLPRRLLLWLVGGLIVLPMALVLVLGLGRLLAAMGDAGGASCLERVALGVGLVWVLDMLCLLLALGVAAIAPRDELDERP